MPRSACVSNGLARSTASGSNQWLAPEERELALRYYRWFPQSHDYDRTHDFHFYALEPVDGAEAADEADAPRFERVEVEIVGAIVVVGLREPAVVAQRQFTLLGREPSRVTQHRHAPGGLQIRFRAVEQGQGHASIGADVLGVLGDGGDQDQRPAALIEAVGHDRAEGIAGDVDRQGRQHAVVAGVQQCARRARGRALGIGFGHGLLAWDGLRAGAAVSAIAPRAAKRLSVRGSG
jgi:hypothetical protein